MIGRFARSRRGGAGLIVAAAMPVLVGATAFAVDLGSAMLETRKLQGAADAAAMAAAADPARADSLARGEVAANTWPASVAVATRSGHYDADAAVTPADRFADAGPANAVKVTLTTAAPTYFARVFGYRSIPLSRTATAAQINLASFSLGSRLAAVNGGVLNQYLSALTGSTLSLSVMDYNALAGANIDLFGFLDALRTTASLSAGSYNSALDATVTSGQILQAAATVAQQNGDIAAAAALRLLMAQSASRTMSLAALIDPGLLGDQSHVAPGTTKVNVLDLLTAALQTATPKRQVALDIGGGIPGLLDTKVIVAIGERPNQSPWLAVTPDGQPIIRTAQTRIYAEVTVGGVSLPGIGGLVAVKLPLYVEMASAEARLKSIDCSSDGSRGVTIEARTGPSTIAIGTIDTARLQDFTHELPVSQATLVQALLVRVTADAQIDLGAAEDWQGVFFNAAQVADADVQTVSSSSALQGVAASLIRNLHPDVYLGPIKLPLSPIAAALGNALMLVAPALDTLVDVVTNTIGVHYGQADVRVTGMRCGTPALVA